MGLYGVLGSALSGLRVTQAGLDVVSRNVSNADTPGYTRKTLERSTMVVGSNVTGIRIGDIVRDVDSLVQRQLRLENSGAGYVRILKQYYDQLDLMLGEPGSANGVDTLFNTFRSSMEALATSPDSFIAREQALRDAQVLAGNLNQLSSDIQAMRLEAERGIGDAVQRANELLGKIAKINMDIGSRDQLESPPADLLDIRDGYISELSELMDIQVMERERGTVSIMTKSGTMLLDLLPVELQFDQRGSMTPQSLYSDDPAERGVGTIRIVSQNGAVLDLIENNQIRSGKISALLELRDEFLVDAQAQLDVLAEALARSLSGRTVDGTATTVGTQDGFDVDLTGIQSGDRVNLTLATQPGGAEQTYTIIRVDDPASLPLDNSVTADPNDIVIGVDFSGGYASVAAQLNAALGPQVDVSAPGGNVLRFLDDGDATANSTGSLYGADGSTLNLAGLNGEALTINVNGVDNVFNFGPATTGQDLQSWLDGLPGIGATIAAGDLVITGDTPADGFSITFSNPSVGTATGLSEGSFNTSAITSVDASITNTALDGNGLAIPLFVDGGSPYTGRLEGMPQRIGFAGRISVNAALLADNTKLVQYGAGIEIGDPARPLDMLRRLTQMQITFPAETKVAGSTPYTGTVSGFVQRIISYQGAIAQDVSQATEAQETVVAQLEERFTSRSGVNIDQEMAHLIELQTAYQANTRLITAFREMMDLLMRM
ncbi:flagellar hook-associated protein FlgK [Microbaculum marinisediminis]|uniref:Flagellar hook-associated protein 1 n=1 Tax=Microbaculum marinisediminis TaxID=2931392 RepID=A0AAW5QY04_9HYPH|nr:flagellar hook-associated protein FlgK [Microbaculum sp. A6E488]MCT8972812.1 flagellar hook-associated protein FlgK [Microbaculum sp. A6E488]